MAKQYGAPDPIPGAPQKGKNQKYGDDRRDPEPQAKPPDPSPPADLVQKFHKNASVDKRKEDIHHTIGLGSASAAAGDHSHNGADSVLLLEGITITGSKSASPPTTVLTGIMNALARLGVKDSTT